MVNMKFAPTSGRVLAYGHDRLVYDRYALQEERIVLSSGEALDLSDIYELHLFDAETEYRAVREGEAWVTQVMRAQDEISDEDHFVFSETQFVRERYWVDPEEKIVVNNHFSFNEDGFLRLEGYRLAMEAVQ